jgi:hypothetical protein
MAFDWYLETDGMGRESCCLHSEGEDAVLLLLKYSETRN